MGYSPKVEKWRAIADKNPAGFVRERLRIPDLLGREVPFRYKWAQKCFSDVKRELHRAGKPLRLWVMKWRRAGISSAASAEDYAIAYGRDNARIGIIAHQEERAKELLANYKGYDKSLRTHYPDLYQEMSKDNIFGIKFKESGAQVLIGTAENPIKIRGDGIHILQGTEAAHWFQKFRQVTKEVCPVVPPLPGSQIIYESTGSLMGSAPYEHYQDALPLGDFIKGKARGKNEFIRMFLCWLDSPDERIPFNNEKEFHELQEIIRTVEPRLADLNAFYKLSPEQIHASWQMFSMQADNDFEYFCREFPYTESMAWAAGGASYFGSYMLDKAKPVDPEYVFQLDMKEVSHVFQSFDELKRGGTDEMYPVIPEIKVWALPRKGGRYCIGSDSASGDYEGDPSYGQCIDIHTRELMASYNGFLRPDEAAFINVSLARIYNNAILAPEINPGGGGMEALNMIQRLQYFNIYQWRKRDHISGIRLANTLGWWTTPRTRPIALGELRKVFLDAVNSRVPDAGIFKDKHQIQEMRTFGINPITGRPEANANCHDDRVMGGAIAHQVAADEVYCTGKDLLYAYHKFDVPKAPIDQAALISKVDPQQALRQLLDPRSNFMRNKFEL